ncbi:MAG: hypothetical protein ACOYBX_07335 [Mycobacterium sp.]
MQMPVAVRSPLIAGAALAVSLTAMTATPAVPVSLAAFDSPLTELLQTGLLVNNDIFNGSDTFGDYQWEPYQGAVPEFIYTALPILSQMGFNGALDIGGTVDAVGTSAIILSQAAWNLPAAVVTATQQAIGGDIPGAITTLTNATLVPLQSAVSTVAGALGVVVNAVVTRFTNFIAVVPGILQGLVTTTVGSVQAVISAAVTIVTQTVGALSTGDVETGWNTVVDGLLGPVGADGTVESSIPGTIEAMTLGPGLGPLGYPNGYAIPSVRMWGEQSQLQIANAIGASYPVPAAAKRSAAKTVRSAAAAKPASSVTEKRRRG